MRKRIVVITGIALCLVICNGAEAGVVDFFVPFAPSGPSMPGAASPTDALSILASAGSVGHDYDGDGWADASPGGRCNPMGYVVLHHSNWRLNVHLHFIDWGAGYGPFWAGVGGDGSSGQGGGLWGFGDGDFGYSEDPDPGDSGGFGVGEEGTVPEPCSFALLIAGGVGVLLRRRREK